MLLHKTGGSLASKAKTEFGSNVEKERHRERKKKEIL